MKAAVLPAFGQPLEVREVPEPPQVAADDVLIRVRAVGLCGTDLKIVGGAIDTVRPPLILGHEVAGEVVSAAPGLQQGERVACCLYDSCAQCRWCQRGQYTLCPHARRIGFERDGGLAEYIAVRAINALPCGRDVSWEEAAVAMDAVTTPWRALTARARLIEGEYLVVIVAGGLGLNAIQIAHHSGARVASVDPLASHRDLAVRLGAEVAVEPGQCAAIVQWAQSGADVAFEASGTRDGIEMALACLRPGGRLVCCGYRPGIDVAIDSAALVLREISVFGSRAGGREDARAALRLIEQGIVRPPIAETVRLEDVNAALDRLRRGAVLGRLVVRL